MQPTQNPSKQSQKQQPQSQNPPKNKTEEQIKPSEKQLVSRQQLTKELLQMGFQEYLIEEALTITLDKDKAIEYIVTALDEGDGKKMMKMGEQGKEEDFEDVEEQYKMIFLVRMDLKMGLGKIAAQVGHATLKAYKQMEFLSDKSEIHEVAFFQWLETGQKKIVVKVNDEPELLGIVHKAQMLNINNCYIRDAGLTQIEAGSVTVAAIGPAGDSQLKSLTGHLKLL